MVLLRRIPLLLMPILTALVLLAAPPGGAEVYHYYFGNTHSHTSYSDGGASTPEQHFKLAKSLGYDFYAVTNHALKKYKGCTPENYESTKQEADRFTDSTFVGICGFEYSENDGPNGTGHINALNTTGYLDATGPDVNLPVFYDWMAANQPTTVAASFNHPSPTGYNSYDYLTASRREPITMFEMINSGNLKYEGYMAALKKGWRVAPIAGLDAHGTDRIPKHFYRTGVLAASLTRENIMQAMRARRVYCTWDKNLRVMFSANGGVMGSVIPASERLGFFVSVYDPDISDPKDQITKLEIVGDDGKPVVTSACAAHSIVMRAEVVPGCKWYFLKVYTADKTDGPTAYSAPVWVE